MLERLRKHLPELFFPDRIREVTFASTRLPFVLIQDGQERALVNGETISLNPGTQVSEYDKIQSFLICPNPHNLSLKIRWEKGSFVNANWGLIDSSGLGVENKKFGINLVEQTAFILRDGKFYIIGSDVYFDKGKTRLHGDGWTLEYRPS